jgi:hypothetical protein
MADAPKVTKTEPKSAPLPGGDSDELTKLREENAELRRQLDEADDPAGAKARRVKPTQPSFGISEGIRDQLEREGKAVDPFTGKTLTKDDLK